MQLRTARVRFYGDLADLAGDADRDDEAEVFTERPRSVKDAIESCGVPHTEVDLVLVDGASVDFDRLLRGGERVSAYPPFGTFDVDAVSKVRPDPLSPPRFALDVHLGRLAERLRLLGLDTLYRTDFDDAELAALAAAGPRWLLTRDRGLLMRRVVTHGYLVRADDPDTQALEVARRFRLRDALSPFTRCANCNAFLEPVAKEAVAHRLEPATRVEHDTFVQCAGCGQVYWKGSHRPALDDFVARVRAAAGR